VIAVTKYHRIFIRTPSSRDQTNYHGAIVSVNTSTPANPLVVPSEAEINALMAQFESLAERAKFLIFQDHKLLIHFSKQTSVTTDWQQLVLSLTNTIFSFLLPTLGLSLLIPFSVLSVLVSGSQSSSVEAKLLPTILLTALLVLGICVLLLAYSRWIIFIRYDQRLPLSIKILLSLLAGLVSTLFTYYQIYPDIQSLNSFTFTLISATAIFTFPMLIFLWIVLFNILFWGARTLVATIIFHRPTWQKAILRLLRESFPLNSVGEIRGAGVWSLTVLEPRKFRLLQEWSKINRDHTEKRLIPSGIFFAVLSIAIEASTGVDAYSSVISKLFSFFAPLSDQNIEVVTFLPRYLLFLISLLPFLLIVTLLANLFNNLAIRSLIVEACEWATYFRPEEQPVSPLATQNGTGLYQRERRGFLAWLRGK
jgi:hypothetical protein